MKQRIAYDWLGAVGSGFLVVFLFVGCTESPQAPPDKETPKADPSIASVLNRMGEIVIGLHRYHDTHRQFPPVCSTGEDGKQLLSWRVHILPFIGQQKLYDQFHLNEPWNSPHNRTLIAQVPPCYLSPDEEPESGRTRILAVSGAGAAFNSERPRTEIKDVRDGVSLTLMVVRVVPESAVVWTQPQDWDIGSDFSKTLDDGSGFFIGGLGDGTIRRFATVKMSDLLAPWLTINGAETVDQSIYYDPY